ncbi:MAG: Fic family protein [Clostridiales bacterium]|nr:Fic family protein [Clostridiales bacterium]
MERYEPPFEITNRMLNRVSSISEKLGRIETRRTLERQPHLRRNNRIQSVHSSLKIEANSLSLDSVRDVLNAREVIGPAKEIQEVKNAFAAYDQIDAVDSYSLDDLLRLHGVMTRLTVEESGMFRSGAEGVYRGGVCIHIAPPPEMVPPLMRQLFDWIAARRGEIHPLILSSVFHYEFVFIHPFRDGNGRMARLWQTALLSRWNPLFEYIPIESQIERFQDGYYDAIAVSTSEGSATAFVEFMLDRIDEVLDRVIAQEHGGQTEQVKRLLAAMEYDTPYTAAALMRLLGLKSRDALRNNYLNPAIEEGLIQMTVLDKPTSRNQRYIKI